VARASASRSVPLDVTSEEQAKRLSTRRVEKFGRIDVLSTMPGYSLPRESRVADPTEQIERQFETTHRLTSAAGYVDARRRGASLRAASGQLVSAVDREYRFRHAIGN